MGSSPCMLLHPASLGICSYLRPRANTKEASAGARGGRTGSGLRGEELFEGCPVETVQRSSLKNGTIQEAPEGGPRLSSPEQLRALEKEFSGQSFWACLRGDVPSVSGRRNGDRMGAERPLHRAGNEIGAW